MSIILRVGQTLQLPSRNVVVIVGISGLEVTCLFAPGCKARGEIVLASRWLERFAIVLDNGR